MDTTNDLLIASPSLLNSDRQPLSTDSLRVASAQSSVQTDLLWRNSVEGTNTSWSMNGTQYVRNRDLTTVKDPNWQLTATGDYNRDGQDDILWRNSAGNLAWWIMDGTTIVQAVYLTTLAVQDPAWQIVGTGDYNQDGQVDLLWRNKTDGSVAWWVMNGTSIASAPYLPTLKDANLTIVGTGDFNQDGQVDLLWRNAASGETFWWVMNSTSIAEKRNLPPVTDLNWQIAAVGDFNSDGKADLVWRNSSTGANGLWLMNGVEVTDTITLNAVPDTNWKILGVLHRPINGPVPLGVGTATPAGLSALIEPGTLATAIAEPSAAFSSGAQVSATHLNDFYRFTIAQSGVFNASLTGLSGDADVRLIQDANQNGAIDTGEVLAWQWERGTASESIRRFLSAGTYYAQVMSYEGQTANYSLTTNFAPSVSDDQKFEFKLDLTQGLTGLTDAAKAAIVEAAKFWETAITSRSAITRSNQLAITITGKSLVYSNGSADTGTLALSGPQFALDGPNLIISSGTSTINARRFAEFNANPTYLRDIMIHEFAHMLGFGTLWEPVQFRDATGQIFSVGKNLIDRTSVTYKANTYAGWAYGELTGSSGQVAVPIEAGAFSHWDETRFDTELMTPYAEKPGIATPLSQLTLASLRDLGWNLNFGVAQAYSLPSVSLAAAPTLTSAGSQQAAYTSCGCARCLAASKVYTLNGSTLTEAVGDRA